MLGLASVPANGQTPAEETSEKAGAIEEILDSICAEGYNLFTAECVNWISTDSLLAHFRAEEIGGKIMWQPTIDTWSVVFTDKEKNESILEFKYDIDSKERSISLVPRPLSWFEKQAMEKKNLMYKNAVEQYGDSLRYNPEYGRLNFDYIRIDDNTTRLYIVHGVERAGIIPFGYDYSIDFDNDCNIKAFRRYHNSFLPQPNDAVSITHSHLKNNPYITPTDICTFLLYRGEMKETSIYSSALKGYILYDAETNTATFLTTEEMMERIK